MRATRLRAALLIAPLALALAACGSTVPVSSSGQARGSDQLSGSGAGPVDGSGATAGSATGASPGAGTGSGAGATSSGTGGPTRGGGGTGSGAGATGGGSAGAGTAGASGASTGGAGTGGATTGGPAPVVDVARTGLGWDEKTIYFGVTTQKDAEAAFGSFGFDNITAGNTEKQAQAVADSVNAKGGLFGRQIKLVFRDLPTLSTATDPTAAGNATCAYFTQDRPVIAVINIVTLLDGPNFRTCMAKGRVTLLSAAVIAVDDAVTNALTPYFVQTVGVSWSSLAPALVSSLKSQGYFSPWNVRGGTPGSAPVRVGVVAAGDDVGVRVAETVKRALLAGGIKDVFTFNYADKTQGQQSSVVAFAGKGVTHVIVTDVELFAFMSAANGQGYQPRYGISSYNAPTTNLEGFAPAGQLNGALGVGWAPGLDVNDANDPNANPGAKACSALQAGAGQTFRGKRLALVLSQSICDGILLTVQSAQAGGGLTGVQINQGLRRVGPTFKTAVGFSPALTPSKPFVAGSLRGTAFVPACTCFRYTTPQARF